MKLPEADEQGFLKEILGFLRVALKPAGELIQSIQNRQSKLFEEFTGLRPLTPGDHVEPSGFGFLRHNSIDRDCTAFLPNEGVSPEKSIVS